MALTNYSDLQSQVGNWLARSDLAANIPDFVTLFEACANRRLRTRFQENATAVLSPDATGTAALPADYLAWRNVVWNGSKQQTAGRAGLLRYAGLPGASGEGAIVDYTGPWTDPADGGI